MSGPKSSRYTLTAEQRRILEEQRRLERRKAVALEKMKREHGKLLQFGGLFPEGKQIAEELRNRTGNDGGYLERFSELQAYLDPVASLITGVNREDVNSLESAAEQVKKYTARAEQIAKELTVLVVQNKEKLRKNLRNTIDQGFTTSFADVVNESQREFSEAKEKMRAQLLYKAKNTILPSEFIKNLEETAIGIDRIHDESFLKNYSALTVSPLLKKCDEYLAEYERCHKEFEEVYSEYTALCELYYYVSQTYQCSEESVEKLKEEIQRIKITAAEAEEELYIRDCLDEVMEEMGYTVLGSREVTKRNGTHFRNELYTYGDGTAVNVTYASDGRIAMELGGIDSEDRLPNSQEASALCGSMEQFCDDFKEIEKRLLKKGVVLADRLSMLPPSAEYAQIINMSDYEVYESVEVMQMSKEKKQRRKINGKKQQYREI